MPRGGFPLSRLGASHHNMAIDLTVLGTDFAAVIADMPEALTFNGETNNVVASERRQADELSMPGYDAQSERTAQLLASDWTGNEPGVGNTVSIGGITYRVTGKEKTPDAVQINLDLERETA